MKYITAFISVIWLVQLAALYGENPSVVSVKQTGSAKTRDGALVDACRLAISQVHGGRIIGSLLKTKEDGSAVDHTVLTFGGLLTSYKVTGEQSPSRSDELWKVAISADVLTTIPDRFEGRTAVVVPSVAFLAQAINASTFQESFVNSLRSSIEGWFSNHASFVILERDSKAESFLDAELTRASSSSSAVAERSKLGMEKTADIVLFVESPGVAYESSSTSFKRIKTQAHTCRSSLQVVFKIVDGATKGEIAREIIAVDAKATAKDSTGAKRLSFEKLAEACLDDLNLVGLRLLGALDSTRVKIGERGSLQFLAPSPNKSIDFKRIRSLDLRVVSRANGSQIDIKNTDLGRFEVSSEGKLNMGWSESLFVGDILSFTPAKD